MRARAWVVSGALLSGAAGLSACPAPTGFQCTDDGDCRLDEQAGVCVDTEHCAYPDGECPSGLRYPPGAGTLGGMCVPGEVTPGSGGTMMASATDTPSTGDPSLSGGSTAEPGTSAPPPPPTTEATSESGPSTDSMSCAADDYPDAPDDAMPTETTGDNPECQAEWYGMINDAETEDRDFLVWDPGCDGGVFVMNDLGLGEPIDFCAVAHCNRGPEGCQTGVWDDDLKMCCRLGDATLEIDTYAGGDCNAGDTTAWDVMVRGVGCYEWGVVFSIG